MKKQREKLSMEERDWERYNASRSNVQPNSGQRSNFRPDQSGSHSEHDRWSSQSRDRFVSEHKRDRYDYQRLSGYHRDREHSRCDKR